jgi:hypothetical protein
MEKNSNRSREKNKKHRGVNLWALLAYLFRQSFRIGLLKYFETFVKGLISLAEINNGDPTGNRTRASIPQGGHAKTPAKAI